MRRSQLFLVIAVIGLVGASCAQRKPFPSLAGGATASSAASGTAHGGASGTTASTGGLGGDVSTVGTGGMGGMGGQFNVNAASTGAGMGGGACDQFCGVCACPSNECTMCCVKLGKSDACHSGVCSCF